MANVWKMFAGHGWTSDIVKECIKYNIIILKSRFSYLSEIIAPTLAEEALKERENVSDYDNYKKFAEKYHLVEINEDEYNKYDFRDKCKGIEFFTKVKPDDLIWVNDYDDVYLVRIGERCKYQSYYIDEKREKHYFHVLTNAEWHKLEYRNIAGVLTDALDYFNNYKYYTYSDFLPVNEIGYYPDINLNDNENDDLNIFSKLMYNEITNSQHYKISILNKEETFFMMTNAAERLHILAAWLYAEYGYIPQPAQNLSQEDYGRGEKYIYVLTDPKTGRTITAKSLCRDADITYYHHENVHFSNEEVIPLTGRYDMKDGHVWIFNPTNETKGIYECKDKNVFVADREIYREIIYKFLFTDLAKNLLPKSIINTLEMINRNETE